MKKNSEYYLICILALMAFIGLIVTGLTHQKPLENYPNQSMVVKLLQVRDPENFWQQLGEMTEQRDLNHRLIFSTFSLFDQLQPQLTYEDRVSVDAVKGVVFAYLKYDEPAVNYLKIAVSNSRSSPETRKCLMLLAEIYARQGMKEDLKAVNQQLSLSGEAFRVGASTVQQAPGSQRDHRFKPYFMAVWFLLLIFPASLLELERRNWMKKFAGREDLRGPFIAFMYSPLVNILITVSAIVFLIVGIPSNLGLSGRYFFLLLHVAMVWALCQWPLYLIENAVKKGGSGVLAYCIERARLTLLNHIGLLAVVLTFLTLHYMVVLLPVWPASRPLHATLVAPALFAFYLIAVQLMVPVLLWFKQFRHQSRLKVCLSGGGFRRGLIEAGSLRMNSRIIVCGGLEESLEEDELSLLLERSGRRIDSGSLFMDFLINLLFAMVIAVGLAINPLEWTRFFLSGPGFFESAALLAGFFVCNAFRQRMTRLIQESVDACYVEDGRSEKLIKILEKVNRLNFFPETLREGDRNEFDQMSLDEARLKLRNAGGDYFPSLSRPDSSVLVSLWRSRLAIDWKLGSEEAIFLTSIDYTITGATSSEEELRSLALRHARLGAESIYKAEKGELAIIFCCQKFSAFTAETPLPQQKICEICSEAMKKALNFGPYSWKDKEKGCLLYKSQTARTSQE